MFFCLSTVSLHIWKVFASKVQNERPVRTSWELKKKNFSEQINVPVGWLLYCGLILICKNNSLTFANVNNVSSLKSLLKTSHSQLGCLWIFFIEYSQDAWIMFVIICFKSIYLCDIILKLMCKHKNMSRVGSNVKLRWKKILLKV